MLIGFPQHYAADVGQDETQVPKPIHQVVLVGDRKAAEEAILAPASAARRNVTLPDLMQSSTN